MIKVALINGVLWTSVMLVIFYFANKPITIEIFAMIFVVFTILGAVKFYFKSKNSKE